MKPSHADEKGFTLVELFAVILTVGVLGLTILTSLAANGRDSASIKCLNNLKQMGRAMFEYVEDNEGFVPRGAPFTQRSNIWFLMLDEYLVARSEESYPKTNPIFKCPSYPDVEQAVAYVINDMKFSDDGSSVTGAWMPTPLSEVTIPEETIYVVDYANQENIGFRTVMEYTNDPFGGNLDFHDIADPAYLPYSIPSGEAAPILNPLRRVAESRHLNGFNVLYIGGHAGYLDALAISDIDLWRTKKPGTFKQ